jgi:hypothetical protein
MNGEWAAIVAYKKAPYSAFTRGQREKTQKQSGKVVVVGKGYLRNTDHEPYLYAKLLGQSATTAPTFLSAKRRMFN